jgi:hypothetical protein
VATRGACSPDWSPHDRHDDGTIEKQVVDASKIGEVLDRVVMTADQVRTLR